MLNNFTDYDIKPFWLSLISDFQRAHNPLRDLSKSLSIDWLISMCRSSASFVAEQVVPAAMNVAPATSLEIFKALQMSSSTGTKYSSQTTARAKTK